MDQGDASAYWADMTREHGFEPLRVEGTVPASLRGTLYRAGPATSQRFGRPYHHVFEGDGAICAVRFNDAGVQGAHRLLRSRGYLEEERAGKPLYQTAASPLLRTANLLRGKGKNTGNTNVLRWHGGLFALMEAAGPLAFDAELTTIGETTLGDVVRGPFSAHPHAVAARRTTYNFGAVFGPRPRVDLYALPWDAGARRLGSFPLERSVMLHDFMATERHLVFLISPLQLVLRRFLFSGAGSLRDATRWAPEVGTEVVVVPIDAPTRPRRFKVDPFFQIHFAGGFEDGEDTFVDLFRYETSEALHRNVEDIDRPPMLGAYTRVRIPRRADHVDQTRLCDTPLEFGQRNPRVEGGRHRHLWALTVDPGYALLHVDVDRGRETRFDFQPREFASEPVFVPAPGAADEQAGHVVVIVYDAPTQRSYAAVFDAQRVDEGPVAKAHFDHHIPAGFHGTWAPSG